jgi:hypothetical protein
MKKLLAALLLTLIASRAHAAFSFVQAATPVSSSGTTQTITYSSSSTANDLLVFVECAPNSITISSVTATSSTTSAAIAVTQASGGGSPTYCAVYDAIAGASTTVTWSVTFNSGQGAILFAYEWSGNATSSVFDKASTWATSSTVGTSATTAAMTPTNSNELAISVLVLQTQNTFSGLSFGGGYSARNNLEQGTNFYTYEGDQVLSGSPSTTASATWTGSGNQWGIVQLFFKAAAGSSCTHTGYTNGGALATPNGSSGSYVGNSGAFVTPNCSSNNYWQPSLGAFGVN